MPVEVTWDNPCHTIISQKYVGRWTWDEFYRMTYEQTRMMIFGTPHVVHIIADIQHSYNMSMGGALTHVHNAASAYPTNWGLLVLINANPFINILVDLFKRNHPNIAAHICVATCYDEAYELIEHFENEHAA
jgi:hypothetical protein